MKIMAVDNGYFWTALAVLGLGLSIWFGGPHVKFGEDNVAPLATPVNRLALLTGLLAIWGCYNVWRWWRLESHAGQGDEPANKAAARSPAQGVHRGVLRRALWLRKAKPLYLVIGPSGCGKSTALQRCCGQQAGGGSVAAPTVQPSHCQRWSTDLAELIDVGGNLFDFNGDKEYEAQWREQLRLLLKRHRWQSLRGVVVFLSLADLLLEAGCEESPMASTLTMRLRDISRQCAKRLPVYVIFSKTDAVKGFREFFDDLDPGVRAQPWGFTLAAEAGRNGARLGQVLSGKFEALAAGVQQRLVPRLEVESDATRCAAIHAFPSGFRCVQQSVRDLLWAAFGHAREHSMLVLRGVFFTSVPGPGATFEPGLQALSVDLGQSPESSSNVSGSRRFYFLDRLLHEVLLADLNWLRDRLRASTARPWKRWIVAVFAVSVVVLTTLFWSLNLYHHFQRMELVRRELKGTGHTSFANDLARDLMFLQRLSSAADRAHGTPKPLFASLALGDARPTRAIERRYRTKLVQLLLPQLITSLEAEIDSGQDLEMLSAAVRIYRMFERPDKMQTDEVEHWFAERARILLPANEALHPTLARHVRALLRVGAPVVRTNRLLVEKANRKLQSRSLAERLYARLHQASMAQGAAALDLLAVADSREFFVAPSAATGQTQIEHFYTRRGYEQVDLSPDTGWLREVARDDWVWQGFGAASHARPSVDALREQVKALYFRDYIEHWQRALASLSIAPVDDLRQAERILALGSDPLRSPMVKLLQLAAVNTRLSVLGGVSNAIENSPVSAPKGLLEQVAQSATEAIATDVDRHFRALHDTVDKQHPGSFETVLAQLAAAHALLVEINHGDNPERAAFAAVSGRYAGGANAISRLRLSAQTLPEPARRWVSALADQCWALLLKSARSHLNKQWHARVYRPYASRLKGRYPFTPGVETDATLYDFNQFFKPAGALDLGIDELLKPFLRTSGRWHNREVDGRSLALSRHALQQLHELKSLQRLLYRDNPEMPQVNLELKPAAMQERDARFSLDLGAQRIEYRHGPKLWQPLSWQSVNGDTLARVTFEDLSGAIRRREYVGNWSLFRILDHAQVTDLGESNRFLVTLGAGAGDFATAVRHEPKHEIVLEIRSPGAEVPFRPDLFSRMRLPEWF